jgi:hypothetical protein
LRVVHFSLTISRALSKSRSGFLVNRLFT